MREDGEDGEGDGDGVGWQKDKEEPSQKL
jgi:hypothetical protein